jgi:hypothetical protein
MSGARPKSVRQKLQICSDVIVTCDEEESALRSDILQELVDFCDNKGAILGLDSSLFGLFVKMVGLNIFRALPKRDEIAMDQVRVGEWVQENGLP